MTDGSVCPNFSGLPPANQELAVGDRSVTVQPIAPFQHEMHLPLRAAASDVSAGVRVPQLGSFEDLAHVALLPEDSCALPGTQANKSSDSDKQTRGGDTTCDKSGIAFVWVL